MILVLLGTQNNSFHRLMEEVQKCITNGTIKQKVVVQAGSTKFESEDMEIFGLIEQDKLEKLLLEANIVITHGGVGSIVNSVKLGKKVIAVPRLKRYQEHVNDHQIQIVETFAKEKFIIGLQDVSELEKALYRIDEFVPKNFESNTERIMNIIRNYIK